MPHHGPGQSHGDRAARVAAEAHVDLASLAVLLALLRQALNNRFASSNAQLSGVSSLSRDQNRGEAHATPNEAAGGGPPDAATDGPVRRRTAKDHRRHS